MKFPNVGETLVQGKDWALTITSVDLQKMEGTFKLFAGEDESRMWIHDVSLQQCPGWHKEHCLICRDAAKP